MGGISAPEATNKHMDVHWTKSASKMRRAQNPMMTFKLLKSDL